MKLKRKVKADAPPKDGYTYLKQSAPGEWDIPAVEGYTVLDRYGNLVLKAHADVPGMRMMVFSTPEIIRKSYPGMATARVRATVHVEVLRSETPKSPKRLTRRGRSRKGR